MPDKVRVARPTGGLEKYGRRAYHALRVARPTGGLEIL